MIKILKVKDRIYKNINLRYVDDETGLIKWKFKNDIPETYVGLKNVIIDTLSWIAGQKILKQNQQNLSKTKTVLEKSIVLLVKIIYEIIKQNNLEFDESKLKTNEGYILENLKKLMDMDYANSQLNLDNTNAIHDVLTWYNNELIKVNSCKNMKELEDYIERL